MYPGYRWKTEVEYFMILKRINLYELNSSKLLKTDISPCNKLKNQFYQNTITLVIKYVKLYFEKYISAGHLEGIFVEKVSF